MSEQIALHSPGSRRRFLHSLAGGSVAAAAGVPLAGSWAAAKDSLRAPNERLRIGAIGMRYQGSVIAK